MMLPPSEKPGPAAVVDGGFGTVIARLPLTRQRSSRGGGMTGSSEGVPDNGGSFDGYTAPFCWHGPMDDPKYAVMVNVHRPQCDMETAVQRFRVTGHTLSD